MHGGAICNPSTWKATAGYGDECQASLIYKLKPCFKIFSFFLGNWYNFTHQKKKRKESTVSSHIFKAKYFHIIKPVTQKMMEIKGPTRRSYCQMLIQGLFVEFVVCGILGIQVDEKGFIPCYR